MFAFVFPLAADIFGVYMTSSSCSADWETTSLVLDMVPDEAAGFGTSLTVSFRDSTLSSF